MRASKRAAPDEELHVRLTPVGRRLLPLTVAVLGLAEVLALLDSSLADSGAARAGTLLFVPGLILGILALAPRLARSALRGLELRAPDPVTGFAGDEVRLPIELERRAGRLVARDLMLAPGSSRAAVLRPVGFLAALAPRSSARCDLAWRLVRRGRWRELQLTISTSFPFGLAEARRVLHVPCDVLAYPQLGSVRVSALLLDSTRGTAQASRARDTGSADLRSLRDWREGESQRHVHWKVSARRGQMVVRELEGEERGAITLVLVQGVDGLPRSVRGNPWHSGFEDAVCMAATTLDALVGRHPRVRLVCVGAQGESVAELRSRAQLARAYELLSEVEPQVHEACLTRAGASMDSARRAGESVLAVHAAGFEGQAVLARPGCRVFDVELAQREGVFRAAGGAGRRVSR